MNRGLPVLDLARGRDFLVLTKRSVASGDENGMPSSWLPSWCLRFLLKTKDGEDRELTAEHGAKNGQG